MANTVDLRTYVALERSFVRRLQRTWRIQSAPLYQKITQACLDHKWDEARRLVTDLDMSEVGVENREWITYMLLSCGVFGASIVSKRKPSFVGVGTFDTFLKQTTTNIIQYLEYSATAQVQAEALQSIAEDEAKTKAAQWKAAYDQSQPRDEKGRWTKGGAVDAPPDPKNIVGRLFDRASGLNKRQHEDYQPVRFTDDPRQTRFLLPDGTRLTSEHAMEHSDIVFEALLREGEGFPPRLQDVMGAGVVRYSPGEFGGIDLKAPLTDQQAQVIADDFNITFKAPSVRVDMSPQDNWNFYETLDANTPVTADQLRYWSQRAFKKLNVKAAFDPNQPRDEKGRWTDEEGVQHVGEFVELYHGTSRLRANKILKEGLKVRAVAKPTMGGDPESSRDYIWLAKRMESAKSYSEMHRYPAVLTVQLPVSTYEKLRGRQSGPDSVWSKEAIPAKHIRVQKWDESKHPRDKEGQFAAVEGRQPGADDITDYMEGGGGPERKKWLELNAKVIAAHDAYLEQRDRHRETIRQLSARYNVDNVLDYPEEGYQEYLRSQDHLENKNKELGKLEEALKAQTSAMKIEVVTNLALEEFKKVGVNPWYLNVVDHEGRQFKVGDKEFTEGGHFDPRDRMIELNVHDMDYGNAEVVRGMVSHELSHFVYHTVSNIADNEFKQYLAKAATPGEGGPTPWYEERFEDDPNHPHTKRIKAAYEEELAAEFPATAAMSSMAGGYQHMFKGLSSKLIKENGHSAYAKSYWHPDAVKAKGGYTSAVNETLAEVTRYLNHPESWTETPPSPTSPWVRLTKEMHQYYREREDRIQAAMGTNR